MAGIGDKRRHQMAGVAGNSSGPVRTAQVYGMRAYRQGRVRHFSPQPLRRRAGLIVGAAMALDAFPDQLTMARYARNARGSPVPVPSMTERARLGAGIEHDIAMKIVGRLIHPTRVVRFGQSWDIALTVTPGQRRRKYHDKGELKYRMMRPPGHLHILYFPPPKPP